MAKTLNNIQKSLDSRITDSLTSTTHSSLKTTNKTIKGALSEIFDEVISAANSAEQAMTKADQTDTKVGDLTALETINKTSVVSAINEIKNAVPDIPTISFDTFCSVDPTTEGCSSAGTLTTDVNASKGAAYVFTTTASEAFIYQANFSDLKFGKYALCIRAKVSANTSSSTIMSLIVQDGSTQRLNKAVTGTNFESNSEYCYICTTFNYKPNGTNKNPLTFKLKSSTVSGITISFDYAYVTLLTPAVYI